ncbi:MAG: 50S ribosomal protein L23 [Puniceicoccales bacterium]|jgi:large subunit ribosomal protein L23|nr:50S ribosomal protein L23 [Puniceicoccales bacterium]
MPATHEIIKKPIITEKTSFLQSELNKYTFTVARDAERHQVAKAVEAQFKVKVTKVNIINVKGKVKTSRQQQGKIIKAPNVKKAIVTLEKGDKIEFA